MNRVIIDCHTHVCAFDPRHGHTSSALLESLPFRFMRWRLGIRGHDLQTEQQVVSMLDAALWHTPELERRELASCRQDPPAPRPHLHPAQI